MDIKKENIVIIGASGHAKVIIDIIEKENKFNIIGLVDDDKEKENTLLCGYEILGNSNTLPTLIKKYNIFGCIIAIGDNWTRNIMRNKIQQNNTSLEFITCIHTSAIISNNVNIGKGVVIMANVVINSGANIGDFCIINTSSIIEHDNNIDEFASLAPSATTGGQVNIGKFTAISIGANIVPMIKIGKYSVIGANSTVLNDIDDFTIAYGTPAKAIRKRDKSDKYL